MKQKSAADLELLLPAGSPDALRAAAQNGADAVYLGGKDFSARQNARNFDGDGLKKAVSYCHARGVKVYLALNTLVFDRQLEEAARAVREAAFCGVDAFIIQDWGMLALAKALCPSMRLHASTQMSVHTPAGAELLRKRGVERVVLARELTLNEIREITSRVEIETEVFVHGALCMSVSGQCYLSGMIGGRSGNRGSCAGTCRLPFSPDGKEGHALSLKDCCLASHLEELAEAGATSLKVEGRMKRPEYVAAAARAYSAAREGLPCDMESLRAVFSRSGFTDGYLTGKRGPEMFGIREKEDVTAAGPKLLRLLENTYKTETGRIALDLRLTARPEEPLRLEAADREGHAVEIFGAPPEPAQHRPATPEEAIQRLSKLGGTIFCAGEISADLGKGLALSAAELNRLRREACEQLTERRSEVLPIPCPGGLPALPAGKPPVSPPRLRARFSRFGQLSPEDAEQWELFSLPSREALAHAEELAPWREKLLIEPPRALFGTEREEERRLAALRDRGFSRVLCENIAHVELARRLGMEAHGGVFLNCPNSLAAEELRRLGVCSQELSFELNLADARRVRAELPLGLLLYGYLPLMLTRCCPLRRFRDCASCGGKGSLTDRTGAVFPVGCHEKRWFELYNVHPLWMGDKPDALEGLSFGVLYFTRESRAECSAVFSRFREGLPAEGKFTRGLYYRNV